MQAHGRRFAAASSLHVVARPNFVTLEPHASSFTVEVECFAMSPTMKTLSAARVLRTTSQTSTIPRAYFSCHRANYNSLLGSWGPLKYNQHLLRSSSSSVCTSQLKSRAGLRDSRRFSAFSAFKIDKAGYDRLTEDPVALSMKRAKLAQQQKKWYDKIKGNPEAWEKFRARYAAYRDRYVYGNPEVRQSHVEAAKESHARLSSTQRNYRSSRKLHEWIWSFSWVRKALPWKSHSPLLHDEPVEHYCQGCQFARRKRRLWWKSEGVLSGETHADVSQEAQYLCHTCYTKQRPWSEVMPEGYEDVNTLKALIARKTQLDGATVETKFGRDDKLVRSQDISYWCRHYDWVRSLPWPTHRPLLLEQKTELRCTDCLWAKRRPLRFWWQSAKGDYICNSCYTKPDWSEIMPKGYEDVRSMRDLRARKQQLDELVSGHANTSSRIPSSNHRQIGSNLAQATLTRPTSSLPTSLHSPMSRRFSSTSAATVSEKYKKLRDDPVRYKRYLEYMRLYHARLRSDKKAHRAYLEQVAARNLKRHDEDAASRERSKSRGRKHYAKVAQQPAYLQGRLIHNLLMRYPWSRTGLPWKSHLPLVSAEPIERHCSGCDMTKRAGSKLWWQKIDAAETESDSQSFLCHNCYWPKDDWARAMPEGYEDVKSIRELVARNEQLDGSSESGKYAAEESVYRACKTYYWTQHEWVCLLPWKTHSPVVFKQKVYDRCARCESARHASLKLWWRSPTETICNLCHAKQDWNDAMPQGYEDVRSMKELRARKKQLDEEGPGSEPQHRE